MHLPEQVLHLHSNLSDTGRQRPLGFSKTGVHRGFFKHIATHRSICVLFFMLVSLWSYQAATQVEALLTVLAVRTALVDAMKQFQEAIKTADQATRNAGVSLQSNAQNVLADIDQMFAGNLKDRLDELDTIQRGLMENAKLLTTQIQKSTELVVAKAGYQARLTMADADITAYNALYSLPCRSQIPRILYVTPGDFRPGRDVPEVRVRGNFLNIGTKPPSATIAGQTTRVISRSPNEIVLEIPKTIIATKDSSHSVPIEMQLLQENRHFWLLYCHSTVASMASRLNANLFIDQPERVALNVSIGGSYNAIRLKPFKMGEVYHQEEDCNYHQDDNRSFCLPPEAIELGSPPYLIQKFSANCNSWIADPKPSGSRCAEVDAHVGGCGSFLMDCHGRGWIHYLLTLYGKVADAQSIPDEKFSQQALGDNPNTFRFVHHMAHRNLDHAKWRYVVIITVDRGYSKQTFQLSEIHPNDSGIQTDIQDGALSVSLPHSW
jgi:hypothetical protein